MRSGSRRRRRVGSKQGPRASSSLRSVHRAVPATPSISRASGSSRKPAGHPRAVVLVLRTEAAAEPGLLLEQEEELEDEPRRGSPDEEELAAEQQALAEDQRQDAEVHRVPCEAVGAARDEALGRRPWCGRAATLEREARGGLEHEQRADQENDKAEELQRPRLVVRVPVREQPGDDSGDERRPAEEGEAEAPARRAQPGAAHRAAAARPGPSAPLAVPTPGRAGSARASV